MRLNSAKSRINRVALTRIDCTRKRTAESQHCFYCPFLNTLHHLFPRPPCVCVSFFFWMLTVRVWGPFKVFMYFSAISNTKRLLMTTARKGNENLIFISGFKIFLIFWVIYAHCYVLIQPEFVRKYAIFIFFYYAREKLLQANLLTFKTATFLCGCQQAEAKHEWASVANCTAI